MGGRCPQRQRDDTDAADQIRADQNPADTANQTLADSSASAPRQNELLMQTASAPRRNEGPESSEFSDQFSDWKFADDSDVSDVQATPVAATPPRTNALRRRRRRTTYTVEYVLEPSDVLGGVRLLHGLRPPLAPLPRLLSSPSRSCRPHNQDNHLAVRAALQDL